MKVLLDKLVTSGILGIPVEAEEAGAGEMGVEIFTCDGVVVTGKLEVKSGMVNVEADGKQGLVSGPSTPFAHDVNRGSVRV